MQNPNAYTLRGLTQYRALYSGISLFILVGCLMYLFNFDSKGDIEFVISLVITLWLPALLGVLLHMNLISNYLFAKTYTFLLHEDFIEITINHQKKKMIRIADIDMITFILPENKAGSLLKIYHQHQTFYLYAGFFGTRLKHGKTLHAFLSNELIPYLKYHKFTENHKKEQISRSYTFIKP